MSGLGDILVLGLGRSGRAVASYAAGLLAGGRATSVTVVDAVDSDELSAIAVELRSAGVEVRLGTPTVEGRFDLCVASPGISPRTLLLKSARECSAETISEIEFAFRQADRTWVAITGTNGKTTTTALVTHLLEAGGIPARAVGNIGPTAIDAIVETDDSVVLVAEVSSFQLALTKRFHPRVAVLLNITPDHVDWHGSLEAYATDKTRVFANLDAYDLAVIDVDDAGAAPYAEALSPRGVPVARVSTASRHARGAGLHDGTLVLDTDGGEIRLVPASGLLIKGAHNVSNALAAACAAHAMGVGPAELRAGLASFRPIEHRLEPVGVVDGVDWYNDSKATNPDAVLKALTAFGEQPIVVLLGGRNKGNDFRPLAEQVAARAKAAVLFGESRHELAHAFDGLDAHVIEAVTLSDAVEAGRSVASAGDAVVLSPACASFDEFDSYEHRGDAFRALVGEMAGGDV